MQVDPRKRHEDVSEFVYGLHLPNPALLARAQPPLIERHPLVFWKAVSFALLPLLVAELALRRGP